MGREVFKSFYTESRTSEAAVQLLSMTSLLNSFISFVQNTTAGATEYLIRQRTHGEARVLG